MPDQAYGVWCIMTGKNEERRGSKRTFFTLEEAIGAEVRVAGHEEGEPLSVTLLSISIGGLSFLGAHHQFSAVKVGDRVKITDIQTPHPLGLIDHTEGEIKYINDYAQHARIAVGVKFTDILQLHRKKIFEYVNDRLNRLGIHR